MTERPPLQVLITVDTEVWWDAQQRPDPRRWLYGETAAGPFGVGYQLERLQRDGLKAVFFVEPIFALSVGMEALERLVGTIQDAGQDVQLHLHTEWLPVDARANLNDYGEAAQTRIIARGLELLQAAGAHDINAFRAGNYGADHGTLRALRQVGLRYDSSHNLCYLGSSCNIGEPWLQQPTEVEGITEVPISVFSTLGHHLRPVQLSAVSFDELRHALFQAYHAGWSTFVIVSHSFELLDTADRDAADPVMIDRFDRLCTLLKTHRDLFRTTTFDDVVPTGGRGATLVGRSAYAVRRNVEQVGRRLRAAATAAVREWNRPDPRSPSGQGSAR